MSDALKLIDKHQRDGKVSASLARQAIRMARSERPPPGTPSYQLWLAAIDVALEAPLSQGTHVHAAQIPWTVIHELRAALDALSIDWRKYKDKQDTERRERRRQLDGA